MLPLSAIEAFGLEDPRITAMDGRYYISHTAVSPAGMVEKSAIAETGSDVYV